MTERVQTITANRGGKIITFKRRPRRPATLEKVKAKFWSNVDKGGENGCWIWNGDRGSNGYGRMGVNRTYVLAHRLVLMIAGRDVPKNMAVCHHCDNPPCVNPDHLFIGTAKDNADDMVSKNRGFVLHGEDSHLAKLTKDQVIAINELCNLGAMSQAQIANQFRISVSTIEGIRARRLWKHLNLVITKQAKNQWQTPRTFNSRH